MKRTASRALVAALVTALALSGAVMAKGHPSHGPKADHGTTTGQADKAAKAASLWTKGNASHPGGVFRVLAVVKAGPADRPATVDAIVHFATGDLPVVLTRSGGGSAYHGNVAVPAAEPAGTVLIDATAVVLTVTLKATGSGKIVIGDTAPETAEAPAAPAAAASPATCTSTDESEAPEASDAPKAGDSTDQSEAPEASDAPEAAEVQDAEKCDGDGHDTTLSAEAIAKLVAFIESLFS
jgi:hypothetical protein